MASLCLEEVRENYQEIDNVRTSVEIFTSTQKQNNWYLTKFLFCEVLQLCILLGVILLTDLFLSGMFYSLGFTTINYFLTPADIRQNMMNPVCQVFPTVTSCQFPTGSLTGTVNIDHALCVLSLNIVNDKIFLFEWFWFSFLLLVAVINSCSRIVTLALPCLQATMLRSMDISLGLEEEKMIRRVMGRCKLGDWFLLTLVKKNLDDRQFFGWLKELDSHINIITKKERMRRKEQGNGHGLHTLPHWSRATQGVRDRKCFTIDRRSDMEDSQELCT